MLSILIITLLGFLVTGVSITASPAAGVQVGIPSVGATAIDSLVPAKAPSLAPLNAAFEKYLEDKKAEGPGTATEQGYELKNPPSPVDFSHLTGKKLNTSQERPLKTYPASYDLRNLGRDTPVKDQENCQSCWAFAAVASLESSLLPGETWDFSENHMKNSHGFDLGCCEGGNSWMSTAYFARWSGPVMASDDRYNSHSCFSPSNLSVQKHVQDIYILPDRGGSLDNDNIKWALMTYGAVRTDMNMTEKSYYSSRYHAYYYTGRGPINHAVTIVGWNDTFNKSKFPTTPAGDGAFIVKNNWGASFGENGYFYVSYYDTRIGTQLAVYTAEPMTNYLHVYQYDPLGWVSTAGYQNDTSWFANVFTATADEQLAAVSFYTPALDAQYELYVYKDPLLGPTSTNKYNETTGTIHVPGYHTVKLNTIVPLTANHTFSVVVKLTTPGFNYQIPTEKRISGYSSAARASAGRGYTSSNGTSWDDLTSYFPNSNICLKAFTTPVSTPTPTPIRFLSITNARLVPNYARYFEWDITNTGTADAWVAPDAMFYKPIANDQGYAKAGGATAFYVWDGHTFVQAISYRGRNWLRVPAGRSVLVHSQAVAPADAKWTFYNANTYSNGGFHG